MENIKPITAPDGAKYISQIENFEMPVNCIFNKGKTGCGGTESAINQKGHTIIAVPTINLVKNKEIKNERRQYDVFAVYGDISQEQIKGYANSHDTLKIIVTYDSLEKVVNTLSDECYNVYKDFFLLVDEYHSLFISYAYRDEAIKKLLIIAQHFERVTYMSATPIEQEFILEELKHLPTVSIEWANKTEVTVQSRYTKKPIDYVALLAKRVITENRVGNLHFFFNSVEAIKKAIDKAELSPEQVKIVCRNCDENIKKLGVEYAIEQPSDTVKKVNFYTSTAFEGCDIFDKFGRTYIVSDATKSHTLVDISTLFIQICGRIRDSIYNTDVFHIHSTTRYSEDLTLEEFIARTKEALNETVEWADEVNQMTEKSRIRTFSTIKYLNEKYVRIENNRLIVDNNLVNIDIYNFKITKQIYKTCITLAEEYQKHGLGVSVKVVNNIESAAEKLEINPKARTSFEELFKEYVEIKESPINFSLNQFDNKHYKLKIIEDKNSLVKLAYDKLGKERVEELKYHTTNIKNAITKKLDISTEGKIVQMINERIPYHNAYPKNDIKDALQEIYNILEINRTAMATHLNYWYITKEITKNINGKNTACMMIVRDIFVRVK